MDETPIFMLDLTVELANQYFAGSYLVFSFEVSDLLLFTMMQKFWKICMFVLFGLNQV